MVDTCICEQGDDTMTKKKAKPVTEEQKEMVIKLRGTMKAQDIADRVGITIHPLDEKSILNGSSKH